MEPMEKHQSNRQCWLVVWNAENLLQMGDFFAEIGDGKADFSVQMSSEWERLGDFKKGDKGVIVVKDGESRAIYATFTVTGEPDWRRDTHPKFWKHGERDANKEKMRGLARSDSSFPPIGESDSGLDMGISPTGHWVCEKPMEYYDEVRKRVAEMRQSTPA